MVKAMLNVAIISLLYLMYRTINTPDFEFNCTLSLAFIWFLKIYEERN